MKKIIGSLFFSICSLLATAQVRPQYSQYMLNNYLLNPAITGIEDYLDIKTSFRSQWAGIEGAPNTYYLTAHTQIGNPPNLANPAQMDDKQHAFAPSGDRYNRYKKNKAQHGVGGMILYDKIGIFSTAEATFSYAYHLLLAPNLKLSAGISAGVSQYAMRGSELKLANPNDNLASDIVLTKPIVSAGLWLYATNFYGGIALTQLAGNTFDFGANAIQQSSSVRHLFATAAYKVRLGERLAVIPSLFAKIARPLPVAIDYNLRLLWAGRLWAGASYRPASKDAIFMAGIHINSSLELSYSLDTGSSRVGKASMGSHEIIVGIRLNNRLAVYCPTNMW